MPEAGRLREHVENHGRSFTFIKGELGFFHFLEMEAGLLVPSGGQKILVQPGWYLPPPQKIPLAENRFLRAGKVRKYNGKIHVCFTTSGECNNRL